MLLRLQSQKRNRRGIGGNPSMNDTGENHFAFKMLEQAFAFRAEGEVLPTWFLTTKDGEHHVIGTPFTEDYESKRAISIMLADWIREFEATELVFVSDVWTRSLPKDAPESETLVRPSKSMDAREAICVQVWRKDRTGFCLMRLYRERDNGTLEILSQEMLEGEGETETFAEAIEALRNG
jgi:hypothetical protein